MSNSVEFYFDFSSSYSYIAQAKLRQLAEDKDWKIDWKPIALGAIFKAREYAPPMPNDLKGAYLWRDVERSAAEINLDYTWPNPFPFNSIPAARIFYVIAKKDKTQAIEWALTVFNASYVQGRNCSDPIELTAIAKELDLDGQALLQATKANDIKITLKAITEEAMEKGVFGAPTFFVNGEMYWGADRLDQIEKQLSQT